MSKPSAKITRTIRSEQVLNAFVVVVRKNLPLDLKNTRITADDIIYALAYANVHRLSAKICPLRSSLHYKCQNVFGYPCATWHSCSVVRLNGCGARLRSFNIILVLRFREVLRIIY